MPERYTAFAGEPGKPDLPSKLKDSSMANLITALKKAGRNLTHLHLTDLTVHSKSNAKALFSLIFVMPNILESVHLDSMFGKSKYVSSGLTQMMHGGEMVSLKEFVFRQANMKDYVAF